MNKEKVFIEGYEVGFLVDTTEAMEKKIQVASGEIVSIDERFIYKSIEREKVQIPQFVADWIEECKAKGKSLLTSLLYTPGEVNSWVDNSENQELFACAWIFGYTIEKEKRYLVKMKNINIDSAYLKHQLQNNHWYWGSLTECGAFSPYHTKKELEADDFGWVFDCERIEIEEVE